MQPLCREVIWRHNVGYDFGAYKDGIAAIADIDRLDSLILMNDSVYGPFRSLRDMLAPIDPARTDLWGITDSFENSYHVQTFFMVLFRDALAAPAFKQFWQRLPYVSHKMWVVRNAEVAFTRVLQQAGLRTAVLAPYGALVTTARAAAAHAPPAVSAAERAALERYRTHIATDSSINPMQFFWDGLITDHACPFIKRDLLTANPSHIPFTGRWKQVISANSSYDVSLIERHLAKANQD